MNTKASVAYGWGVLIAAGGGAYYFAKRSINADRQERADAEAKRRATNYRLQQTSAPAPPPAKRNVEAGSNGGPGTEAHEDVSPAKGHVGVGESKYEARDPFRSRKGDRFS